jgi:hypothetical protein
LLQHLPKDYKSYSKGYLRSKINAAMREIRSRKNRFHQAYFAIEEELYWSQGPADVHRARDSL